MAAKTLSERQEKLLEWLKAQRSASMEEIQERFQVSPATAYRDVHALVTAGEAVKTSRGLKMPAPAAPDGKCVACGGSINERAAFVLEMQDGSQRKACCPHCGLMAIKKFDPRSALASDFLYGRMINVRQAVFLLESSVQLCCSPSVLCFANQAEAQRFQTGFGGELCGLEQAAERINHVMGL